MKNKNSEDLAKKLVNHFAVELGRTLIRNNKNRRDLRLYNHLKEIEGYESGIDDKYDDLDSYILECL